jgi:hypothetical protein
VNCGALLAHAEKKTDDGKRQIVKLEIERQRALEMVNKNNPIDLMTIPYQ